MKWTKDKEIYAVQVYLMICFVNSRKTPEGDQA